MKSIKNIYLILWSATQQIYYVAKTIKKFHILSNFHYVYQNNFYHYKQKEIDELFGEYHLPLFKDIYHPELIQELKQNYNASAHEKHLNQ